MPLTRTHHKMPDYIREALKERKLMDAYHERPDYQQNDYIGWITRAKRGETKQKRLAHTCPGRRCRGMLDELEGGKLYMNMKWNKSRTLDNQRSAKK
jgi:hypothetical protein